MPEEANPAKETQGFAAGSISSGSKGKSSASGSTSRSSGGSTSRGSVAGGSTHRSSAGTTGRSSGGSGHSVASTGRGSVEGAGIGGDATGSADTAVVAGGDASAAAGADPPKPKRRARASLEALMAMGRASFDSAALKALGFQNQWQLAAAERGAPSAVIGADGREAVEEPKPKRRSRRVVSAVAVEAAPEARSTRAAAAGQQLTSVDEPMSKRRIRGKSAPGAAEPLPKRRRRRRVTFAGAAMPSAKRQARTPVDPPVWKAAGFANQWQWAARRRWGDHMPISRRGARASRRDMAVSSSPEATVPAAVDNARLEGRVNKWERVAMGASCVPQLGAARRRELLLGAAVAMAVAEQSDQRPPQTSDVVTGEVWCATPPEPGPAPPVPAPAHPFRVSRAEIAARLATHDFREVDGWLCCMRRGCGRKVRPRERSRLGACSGAAAAG